MNESVKIRITEEEWTETRRDVRIRILKLMDEQGFDTQALKLLENEISGPTIDDVYNQFYGDEA